MKTESRVSQIFISPEKGAPMQQVSQVNAIAGVGLEGDRYAKGVGYWQTVSKPREGAVRHVTIISQAAIDDANAQHGTSFDGQRTRRNIVVEGDIDLQGLIDHEFELGGVRMRGVEECDPCSRPSQLSGEQGFATAFRPNGRGGLRAEILSGGTIYEHDPLRAAHK